MQGTAKRISALAMAGVLVFWVALPVPSGVDDLDRMRYDQAHANAAVMELGILGTLLLASGVYIAGATTGAYDANLQDCFDYIEDFYNTNYDASPSTALLGCLTGTGAVNAGLMSAQLRNAIIGYVNDNHSDIYFGIDSSQALEDVVYFNGIPWSCGVFPSTEYTYFMQHNPSGVQTSPQQVYAFITYVYSGYREVYFLNNLKPLRSINQNENGLVIFSNTENKLYGVRVTDQGVMSVRTKAASNYVFYQSEGWLLNKDYSFGENIGDYAVSLGVNAKYKAVVNNAILQGIESLQGVYDLFNPTSLQLEQGISSQDLVDAINFGNGYAADTLQGVNTMIGQLTSLFSVLNAIRSSTSAIESSIQGGIDVSLDGALDTTALQADVNTGFNGVLDHLLLLRGEFNTAMNNIGNLVNGALSELRFDQVMETVIDGVQEIPGAIGDAVGDLLGGVADIPHALEGLLEGVLEGVLSIPGVINLAATGILEAVGDLDGALEGLLQPFFGSPQIPQNSSVQLPAGTVQSLQASLEDKVPFCYLIRSQNALGSMFANFSGARSFYFYLDIPKGDGTAAHVKFDGEPVLGISFGGLDIATTIKVMATALLCLGLLFRAYKIIERMAL